jgi:hypothetical protein
MSAAAMMQPTRVAIYDKGATALEERYRFPLQSGVTELSADSSPERCAAARRETKRMPDVRNSHVSTAKILHRHRG